MSKAIKLKKIQDQVILITGASSGIGLATAKMAAKKGAKVVLVSRNTKELNRIVREIKLSGGEAFAVTADVANLEQVKAAGKKVIQRYGRIDTWVNNAGVLNYGLTYELPLAELRQIMETNFWGVHHGCITAIELMRNGPGGVIVNLGSEVSEHSIGNINMYATTKAAIRAYTEGLRIEVAHENLPIRFSLVRPASINTPILDHAVNHLRDGGEPSLPAPLYHPNVAATGILACAESGKRDMYIGAASKIGTLGSQLFPSFVDFIMEWKMMDMVTKGTSVPHDRAKENLFSPTDHEGKVEGNYDGYVLKSSLWTEASIRPVVATGLLALAGAATYLTVRNLTRDRTN